MEKREKWSSRILLWSEILIIAAFLVFRGYISSKTTPSAARADIVPAPPPVQIVAPERVAETLHLKRGDFTINYYAAAGAEFAARPKALIIFGSGDGGSGEWEDRVCKALQTDGYELVSYDCNAYAKSDYDLDTLQADMSTISLKYRLGHQPPCPPLILGGWSMGAEQAVPAAGGPHPPAGLVGLLLISPGERGRYGLRPPDRWDVPPSGPGTFSLEDFDHQLNGLRIVQWDGKLDILDSKKWLESLTAVHKAYDFPWGMHDYNGASDQFLQLLKESLDWLLSSQQP